MLQLSCCISIRMYIRNLFHLQRTFHCDRIIDSTTDIKDILCGQIAVSEFLDIFLIIQQHLYLCRQFFHILDHISKFCITDLSSYMSKLHCKQIFCDQLTAIRLGSCHCNLRTCPCIHNIICLSGNRASYYIDNTKHFTTLSMRLTDCSQ